jgi:hypothetical protein
LVTYKNYTKKRAQKKISFTVVVSAVTAVSSEFAKLICPDLINVGWSRSHADKHKTGEAPILLLQITVKIPLRTRESDGVFWPLCSVVITSNYSRFVQSFSQTTHSSEQ